MQALKEFRQLKNDENSCAHFFYAMLQDAHPGFINLMEKKAGILLHAGNEFSREMTDAETDPEKKAEMVSKLQEMSRKINSSVNQPKKEEKES